MTNQEAIAVLCKMLNEKREQAEIQAIAKAIGALAEKHEVTYPSITWDWRNADITTSNIDPCKYCSNNPKNGGSGICNCTIPYMNGIRPTYSSTTYNVDTNNSYRTLGLDEIRC